MRQSSRKLTVPPRFRVLRKSRRPLADGSVGNQSSGGLLTWVLLIWFLIALACIAAVAITVHLLRHA